MPLQRCKLPEVYTLRARGFDAKDGGFFTSFREIMSTYKAEIKAYQPTGPYALVGYSFGAILAFELSKVIAKGGDEVKLFATLDQPPHFKERARRYDWYECAMTVAFFLGLMGESYAYENLPTMRSLAESQVLDYIFAIAPPARLAELCMTRSKLDNWAERALYMKIVSSDYDPSGRV